MPAHSLAVPGGCADTNSIENSHGHEHPRSMNYGKRVSTRCRCPTSVPAARCSSHSGWARPGPSKRSGNHPPPRSPPGHGTAPTPSHKDVVLLQQFTPFPVTHLCCLLCRVDDIGEKNCCQNSIRLGAMTNPREKFLDLIEQRVNPPIR